MIVLDTDVLSIIQRGRGPDFDRLGQQLAGHRDEDPAVTIVSFEEQARGWLAQVARARQPADLVLAYARFRAFLRESARWPVLDLTPRAADMYADLRRTYRRHGSADLRIAAIVMAHDALLISGNARDFAAIAGLRFEAFRG